VVRNRDLPRPGTRPGRVLPLANPPPLLTCPPHAGDALLALANDLLLEDTAAGSPWAARCLSAAVQRLIAGQGEDLAFERRDDVTLPEALEMAGDKTAALMACACSIGAVHEVAPPEMAMGLAQFGTHVGLAFQLTDDMLGIWGAPEVTGKPIHADLRARKKSLPVVAALSSGTPEAIELARILAGTGELSEDDLLHTARLVVAAGGKQWAEREANDRRAAAAASLDGIGVPADVRAELIAIAELSPRGNGELVTVTEQQGPGGLRGEFLYGSQGGPRPTRASRSTPPTAPPCTSMQRPSSPTPAGPASKCWSGRRTSLSPAWTTTGN
jgi:hypothetical protein